MKDETASVAIEEFAGLKSKMCSIHIWQMITVRIKKQRVSFKKAVYNNKS